MKSVGIIGASGYTGRHLLQMCNEHTGIEQITLYGASSAGKTVEDLFPELMGVVANLTILPMTELSYTHDAYFLALPHGESLSFVPELYHSGKVIIDLGGDYRLNSAELYQKWYGKEHTSEELLDKKVYGLIDDKKVDYTGKTLVANPGCYPTATLLSLLPMVDTYGEIIESINVSAYSGTTGAGKSPKADLLLSEMYGNAAAYNVHGHRHSPEIFQHLQFHNYSGEFSFVTHLLPVATGIYTTSFINLKSEISESDLTEFYTEYFKDSLYVRVRKIPPRLTWVVATNYCDISVSVDRRSVIVTAAIDNLVKGAAGQAMQNFNKIFGFEESAGIGKKGNSYVQDY